MYVLSPSSLKCKYTNKQKVYFGIMRRFFFHSLLLLFVVIVVYDVVIIVHFEIQMFVCVRMCIVYDGKLVSWSVRVICWPSV